jgi:hypothetical protein
MKGMTEHLEMLGYVFCIEGGERWEASGQMRQVDSHKLGDVIWVAMAPLDAKKMDELDDMAKDALIWTAGIERESP